MLPHRSSTALARLRFCVRRLADLKHLTLATTDGILTRVPVVEGFL